MNEQMSVVLGTVAMEPKGEYSADAYYEKLNTVLYNDSTYMAIKPSHNILPTDTEYWQLIGGGAKKEETVQVFDTVADMKLADLKDGMSAQTLGYYEVNDGGGATYKITDEESQTDYQEELENGLYATLIDDLGDNYYDEITCTRERHYDTDCYVVEIPKYDNNNKIIKPFILHNPGLSPVETARKEHTSCTTNATLGVKVNNSYIVGSVISDGEIIRDYTFENISDDYKYICIDEQRNVFEKKVNGTTAQELIESGASVAWNVFFSLITNGQLTDLSTIQLNEGTDVIVNKHPRMSLGVKSDGTIVILACDGRTENNKGLTANELQTLLMEKECINAWNLDGGGSTSLNINESKINRNIDEQGTKDRLIPYTLNFKKETVNKSVGKSFSSDSRNMQRLNKQIRDDFNNNFLSKDTTYLQSFDMDNVKEKIIIALDNNATNFPYNLNNANSFYLINIPHFDDSLKANYNFQIALGRDLNEIYCRHQQEGNWSIWRKVTGSDFAFVNVQASQSVASGTQYTKLAINNTGALTNSQCYTIDYTNNDIIINQRGTYKIKCEIQFNTNVVGNKYIQLQKNGGFVYTISNGGASVGNKVMIYMEYIIQITQSDINNQTNKINFAYAGVESSGVSDTIDRGKIIIESI